VVNGDFLQGEMPMSRALLILAAGVLAASAATAAVPDFSPAESAAIYTAAGFKVKGKTIGGCDAADPGWPRSSFSIEAIDLNGDGKAEAIVTEGNVACYGRDEMGFTILARAPDGKWRVLARDTGGTMVLKTKHNGWLDIEYGGPGMQKHPVLRFDGKVYK
jgi:hypothetical protein